MAMLTILFSLIISISLIIYFYLRRKYNYWTRKKVPHIKPTLLFGNYKEWILQKEYVGFTVQKICNQFPHEPIVGAYMGHQPLLIVKDPEILKLITITKFSHFNSRRLKDYVDKEPYGCSLLAAYGEDWKFARTNMSPMFSTMHLKNMLPLIEKCAVEFEKYIDNENLIKPVEVKQLISSYTMASLVSCIFSVDLKNFDQANVFLTMAKKFFNFNNLRGFFLVLREIWPSLFYALSMKKSPDQLTMFLQNLCKNILMSRNYELSARKDFIDLFINLKESPRKLYRAIDDEYIAAQSISLFLAGFETSAGAVSFLLYELAKHSRIQEKVHEEIDNFLKNTGGKVTFDCVTELPYLNACMNETMRLYPVSGIIGREVTKNYTLPSGVVLEEGLKIHLPIYYLHHNPDYFPQPEEFRPERFFGDTKQEIVPYSYIPFGVGPRICIGKRFAMLQSLTGVVTILRNHKVLLADGMPNKLPLKPNSSITQPMTGIYVKFLCRK